MNLRGHCISVLRAGGRQTLVCTVHQSFGLLTIRYGPLHDYKRL